MSKKNYVATILTGIVLAVTALFVVVLGNIILGLIFR